MRIVFKEISEFQLWLAANATSIRNEIYVTEKNEIVCVPLRSTRPIKYAILVNVSAVELEKMVKNLQSLSFRVYRVKALEWSDDSSLGAKTRS